ncbi:hypothetical protein GQ44DRAFT_606676 [Phaeosphaeriaceae sp. PMI808]|nr:hypothetical protein GQ44DRAFT_606676 [Phaeosphaeriaceae sp. PMI808]
MKSFIILTFTATALAQVTPPAGCQASASGTFNIQTVNVTGPRKRDLSTRQLAGPLTLTLQNGNLKDQAGRIGYIASNFQLQFDNPIQAGARESSGFSLCSNGSLALSSSSRTTGAAIWFQCLSGTFYNLYSQSTGAQCIPIFIQAVNQGSGGGASQTATQKPGVSQIPDGQPQASSPRAPIISQISDGQPQAPSARPPVVTQISDGQPQAPTPRPVGPVVTQISDGQPQAPMPRSSARIISQISDGQPQAPTPAPPRPVVSQISDGQPQAPTPRPIVSQISDGQPQAPVATPTVRTNSTVATPSAPAQFTGAAAIGNVATGAFVAGLLGLFALF